MDLDPIAFFELVCDRIATHPSYAANLEQAVSQGDRLVLNYHTHGPEHGYCVSVCVDRRLLPALPPNLEELAHIRGIGTTREECEERMGAFATVLVERYGLAEVPLVYLDGVPLA